MKVVKYIGYYADAKHHSERLFVLAATNKMDYICKAINENDCEVLIVSASGSKKNEKGGIYEITPKTKLKLFRSFGKGNVLRRVLSRWYLNLCFFFYLLFNIKKNEKIIVYHSLGYMGIISLLKRFKKFKLVLEVEEIYSDVIGDKKKRNKELKFFNKADSYIFPTKMLDELINTENKDSIIIHGTYQVEEKRKKLFNDDIIHVVYAGTFDSRKGGAAAAAAGMFLSEKYHLHILGLGTKEDTKNLLSIIEEVSKKSKCTITYDGLKSGEKYIEFIQSCNIGLSPQNPDAAFNSTSFPSKILSYMANGLRVVSVRIPAIESSAIGKWMNYYDEQTPEKIAEAVMNVDVTSDYDSRKIIAFLNERFVKSIGDFI